MMPQAPHPYVKIGIVVLSMERWLVSARGDSGPSVGTELSDRRKGPGPSGCSRLREVMKLVWDRSPNEGEPVVAALSPRFPCLGTGCMGASCSLR